MKAHIVDEFLVLNKYRVMVLDKNIRRRNYDRYRIGGKLFEPVPLHGSRLRDPIPRNYIAVKGTASFKGAAVELM